MEINSCRLVNAKVVSQPRLVSLAVSPNTPAHASPSVLFDFSPVTLLLRVTNIFYLN